MALPQQNVVILRTLLSMKYVISCLHGLRAFIYLPSEKFSNCYSMSQRKILCRSLCRKLHTVLMDALVKNLLMAGSW